MVMKLYSITDWDYPEGAKQSFHEGSITWDDLVDEDLNVIVTICTVAIAKEECAKFANDMLISNDKPIFILSEDNIWDIYLDVAHFTVQDIQKALDGLSKITSIKYQFTSDAPPSWFEYLNRLIESKGE